MNTYDNNLLQQADDHITGRRYAAFTGDFDSAMDKLHHLNEIGNNRKINTPVGLLEALIDVIGEHEAMVWMKDCVDAFEPEITEWAMQNLSKT